MNPDIEELGPRRGPLQRLAINLVEQMAERIHSGAFKPGSKLPTEYELMRDRGVSRAVVREAISRLQAAGLVESRQGVGTFVLEQAKSANFRIDPATVVTVQDVLDLLQLRMSLETEAAGLAATKHNAEQLKQMRKALDAFGDGSEDTAVPDFQFHLRVAAATGNKYFGEIMSHLGMVILPRMRVNLAHINQNDVNDHLRIVNQEHLAIYNAIANRDAETARAAMRIHLCNSRDRIQRLKEASVGSLR